MKSKPFLILLTITMQHLLLHECTKINIKEDGSPGDSKEFFWLGFNKYWHNTPNPKVLSI